MEREDAPAQLDSVFLLEAIGTHGTEVAPGSDVIEKNLYNGCAVHGDSLAAADQSSYNIACAAGSDEAGVLPVLPSSSCDVSTISIFMIISLRVWCPWRHRFMPAGENIILHMHRGTKAELKVGPAAF